MKKLLGDEIDTVTNKEFTPVESVVNRSGYYFIIREKCNSGVDCAEHYLLRFDLKGRFERVDLTGQIAAEESHSEYFDYKLESDSVLVADKIDYNKDSAIDTIKRRIRLLPQ